MRRALIALGLGVDCLLGACSNKAEADRHQRMVCAVHGRR